MVNSGIRLLERARRRRLPVVIVNRGATRADSRATVKIDAGTSEVLRALAEALPRLSPRADRPRARLGSNGDVAYPRPPRRDRLEPHPAHPGLHRHPAQRHGPEAGARMPRPALRAAARPRRPGGRRRQRPLPRARDRRDHRRRARPARLAAVPGPARARLRRGGGPRRRRVPRPLGRLGRRRPRRRAVAGRPRTRSARPAARRARRPARDGAGRGIRHRRDPRCDDPRAHPARHAAESSRSRRAPRERLGAHDALRTRAAAAAVDHCRRRSRLAAWRRRARSTSTSRDSRPRSPSGCGGSAR